MGTALGKKLTQKNRQTAGKPTTLDANTSHTAPTSEPSPLLYENPALFSRTCRLSPHGGIVKKKPYNSSEQIHDIPPLHPPFFRCTIAVVLQNTCFRAGAEESVLRASDPVGVERHPFADTARRLSVSGFNVHPTPPLSRRGES